VFWAQAPNPQSTQQSSVAQTSHLDTASHKSRLADAMLLSASIQSQLVSVNGNRAQVTEVSIGEV